MNNWYRVSKTIYVIIIIISDVVWAGVALGSSDKRKKRGARLNGFRPNKKKNHVKSWRTKLPSPSGKPYNIQAILPRVWLRLRTIVVSIALPGSQKSTKWSSEKITRRRRSKLRSVAPTNWPPTSSSNWRLMKGPTFITTRSGTFLSKWLND